MLEKQRPEFHAGHREVKVGLHCAECSGETNPDARAISDSHIGTGARNVKVYVEQMALGLGSERLIWNALPQKVRAR